MNIIKNILLVTLAIMLMVQVNCKRGNEIEGKRLTRSRLSSRLYTTRQHTENHVETETITATQTYTEHAEHSEHSVENTESKTETETETEFESPQETSVKKEKYKIMFLISKPHNVQDTLEQNQIHGNKKQRQN